MIDKNGCIKQLQLKISQIKTYSKPLQTEIENTAKKKYNIGYGQIVDIFNDILPIENQPYHMLYKIMDVIKEVVIRKGVGISTDGLDVNKYFTTLEQDEFKAPIPKKDNNFDIVIKSGNWHLTDVFPYKYITIHTDINEVIRWRDYNKLRFNPKTQRDLIIEEVNGVKIYKLDLNQDSIKEMQSDMLAGDYFNVQGAININPETNNENINFTLNGDIVIPQTIKMDLLEGFHNYVAATNTKDQNKDWNFPCEYRIYFLNTQRANKFILQMDKKNHFKPVQTKRLDINNPITYVLNTVMYDSNFYLKNTINEEMYSFLYDLLSKTFDIDKDDTRHKAFLVEEIKDKTNKYILNTDHFDVPLQKEEWFLIIYLIKNIDDKTYSKIISNSNFVQNVLNKLVIKNNPTSTNYLVVRSLLEEEI